MDISDETLRLECLKIVTNNGSRTDFPIYQMIEATMLFRWIKDDSLPISGNYKQSEMYAGKLLEKVIDELIDERKNSNQSSQSSNGNANDLQIPESIINRFIRYIRRK
jgi:hypothetical protein